MADAGRQLPPLRLRDTFPPVPTAAWEALVQQDLASHSSGARVRWHTDEGLVVKPFFRREDLPAASSRGDQRRRTPGWRIVEQPSWPDDAIRADLLHDAGATAVHELAWSLAEAVDRLAGRPPGTSVAQCAANMQCVFAVGSTYFTEIAKLRAARRLWAYAVRAFDDAPDAVAMVIHARTARANKSTLDPAANLLRVTTEAMSAVIGGADVVLVEPYGFAPHLAANVQHVLAQEAHLGATADPAGGAYYVEWLTEQLASAAWTLFQQVEAAGGYTAASAAGLLASQLAEARTVKEREVATRRRTLVGVNAYPSPESPPADLSVPVVPDERASGSLRLAAPYEALRARTQRHAAASGRVPHVHLLTRGDLTRRTARAAFSRDVFGSAGFRITEGPDVPAAADLLVLCGADDDYPVIMRELPPTVVMPVIVAGRPQAHLDALVAAGVQDFVYAGMDAVAVLGAWQDRLGMTP